MKFRYKVMLCLILALGLGLGSAVWAVNTRVKNAWQINGCWRYNTDIGSRTIGLYDRAAVARSGLFALNKSETIYFTAGKDDQGQPLTSAHDFRIEGRDIGARWWSITLYGHDYFMVANEKNRYSYNMANLVREADGSYIIHVSRTSKPGNWIPCDDEEVLYLTLRLYNPDKSVYDNPGGIELPRVTRE